MPEAIASPLIQNGARLHRDDDGQAPNGERYDQAFIASTERMASDGGVIRARGWKWDGFSQNPRFIAMHDIYGFGGKITDIVGGTVVDLEVRSDLPADKAPNGLGLVAYVRFANTDFGKELRTLYLDGDLDAVSVRWDPTTQSVREPNDDEKAEYGDELRWVVESADLMELSAVILGADEGALALRTARSKGKELPLVSAIVEQAAEDEGDTTVANDQLDIEDELRAEVEVEVEDNAAEDESDDDEMSTRAVDSAALGDALAELRAGLEVMDRWFRQGSELRAQLEGVADSMGSLLEGDADAEATADAESDDERSADAGDAEADDDAHSAGATALERAVDRFESVVERMETVAGRLALGATTDDDDEKDTSARSDDGVVVVVEAEEQDEESADDAEMIRFDGESFIEAFTAAVTA